jgi:hypothetical protein
MIAGIKSPSIKLLINSQTLWLSHSVVSLWKSGFLTAEKKNESFWMSSIEIFSFFAPEILLSSTSKSSRGIRASRVTLARMFLYILGLMNYPSNTE